MFLQPKDTPVVKANAFENSIAIKQTMIQDRNLRVRFGIKLSVDIDFRILNARGRAWASFNRRFYYCLSSRLVSFRFVYHQRVTGFHIMKNLGVSSRNSSEE